ncbi:ATPase domain-containing protein [Halorussus halophilus]|uniref:ATPase domain-containing protein n=1 Tax=Halorussus halophilus TaxID=2650975 RepID=UPI001301029C|nr:ATPase domain-containing protein [Halorussus halophilus]
MVDADAPESGDSSLNDAEETEPGETDPDLCDFCRLPRSKESVILERDGATYEFCSEACRTAMKESDRVFTEYHGFRRFETGVAGFDNSLPQGLPRNSFVLLSGSSGTRETALLAELVWRALQREEPAVVVTFTEPPISVVEQFLSLDWNILPYLEDGQIHIADCFTYRVSERSRMFERMNEWNRHLLQITEDVTETIRDPSDVSELQNKLDNCLEGLEMSDRGVVVIDSLTEFGTLVQPVQAYNFVKDIRADICKGRFVPIFAGATYTGNEETFPHDLGYAVDGVVDLELNGTIVKDTLLKRLRIRKMSGVLAIPEWTTYEFTAGKGLVTFDPIAEMDDTYDDGSDEESGGPDQPSDAPESAETTQPPDDGGRVRPPGDGRGESSHDRKQ